MSVMCLGFPGGSVVKNWPANAGDTGSIPGPGRSPGEGNGNPLRSSCLGNPMDRGAKSRMELKRLHVHARGIIQGCAGHLEDSKCAVQ